jgi:hypothetical protein
VDSLRIAGQRTDIAQLIRTVSNRRGMERPGAVVVISDGNSNTGEPPVTIAEQSGIGWYTIGLGDTVPPVDVAVQSLLANPLTVVGRQVTISAALELHRVAGQRVQVVLEEEGRPVVYDSVRTEREHDRLMVHLPWTPTAPGLRKVTVRAIGPEAEATRANNAVSEYVQVRTDKRSVTVFAGAPSADLTFVRSELERDPAVDVRLYVQKQGAEFYVQPPSSGVLAESQTCLLLGFPVANTPVDVVRSIAAACERGLPLLFIPSKETDYTKLRLLEPYLPFSTVSSRPTEFMVTPNVNPASTADPLLRIEGKESDASLWNTLPPIFRTETYVMPAAGAEALATIRVNNVPLPDPLVLRLNSGKKRSVAILGYGLHRWRLMGVAPSTMRGENVPDVLSSFLSNTMAWLIANDQERRIRVRTTHTRYAPGEAVVFNGTVMDESFAPQDGADVRVTFTGAFGKRDVVLADLGGGRYSANVGSLPAGEYAYSARVSVQGRGLGTDAGRFSVGELGLEDAALTQNAELLKALSERSGAQYGTEAQAEQIAKAALKDPRLRPHAVTSERDRALWHMPWPLVLAIGFFSLEWFIRKQRGMV